MSGDVEQSDVIFSGGIYEHLKRMFCNIPQGQKTESDILAMGYTYEASSTYLVQVPLIAYVSDVHLGL